MQHWDVSFKISIYCGVAEHQRPLRTQKATAASFESTSNSNETDATNYQLTLWQAVLGICLLGVMLTAAFMFFSQGWEGT